ncbi:uncharacterized protein LOC133564854 [Nerophis ophidion]|uniref:uncharacterized protein LOC133564854 n=1 Tax=Nerophis ophidion TaxID=159077 RepID=UPI002ADFCA75|nr:uncharacterized protein LOC133564854 [Nerophis ophidion]
MSEFVRMQPLFGSNQSIRDRAFGRPPLMLTVSPQPHGPSFDSGPHKSGHLGYRTHQGGSPQDNHFGLQTRCMQNIIIMMHHQKNINNQNWPPTIKRMVQTLTIMIKPAQNNAGTQALISVNAKNWADTTIGILRKHYLNSIKIEMDKLTTQIDSKWRSAFFIASNWAKKKLGSKLTLDTLKHAETQITSLVSPDPHMATTTGDQDDAGRATPSGPTDDVTPATPPDPPPKPRAQAEIHGEFRPSTGAAPAVPTTPQPSTIHAEATCPPSVTQEYGSKGLPCRRPVIDRRPWTVGPRPPQVRNRTYYEPPPTCRRLGTERLKRTSAELIRPPEYSSYTIPVEPERQPSTDLTDVLTRWFRQWTGLSHMGCPTPVNNLVKLL